MSSTLTRPFDTPEPPRAAPAGPVFDLVVTVPLSFGAMKGTCPASLGMAQSIASQPAAPSLAPRSAPGSTSSTTAACAAMRPWSAWSGYEMVAWSSCGAAAPWR
jgi:hypothetical protein